MNSAKIVFIFFLCTIDGMLFYSVVGKGIYIFIVLHLIIYLVIRWLAKELTTRFIGVPDYLILFLPGLGALIVSIIYLSLFYFKRDSMVLDDYERYLEFERFFEKNNKLDYEKEIGVISYNDQMKLLDAVRKKDLIVDYSLNLYGGVDLLFQGVTDEDNEVRHYSAVTINMFENNYTNLINTLREEYNNYHSVDSILKLSTVYKEYLESGIVSQEIYNVINREYIEVILKIINNHKETLELIDDLVKAYIRSKNLVRAEEFNKKLISNYPDKVEGILNQVQICYEKKAFKEIKQILENLELTKFHNQEKAKLKLSYWLVNEGKI